MSADIMIKYPCEVRRQVSDAKLMQMLKSSWSVKQTLAAILANEPSLNLDKALNEYKVVRVTLTADGRQEQRPVALAEIAQEAAPLPALATHCANCKASVLQQDFGCAMVVNYPLTECAEHWLLARLPDDVDSPAMTLLRKFLKEADVDGKDVDTQRKRPDMFQRKQPVERKWGGFFSRVTINSSQLLRLMLFSRNLTPANVKQVHQLLNCADPTWAAGESVPQDDCTIQLKQHLRAIATAAQLGVGMMVDA